MALKQRAEILHRVGELIEERAPEIAKVETRDNGSLLRSMTNSVIPRAGYNFHFFADHLDRLDEIEDFDTRGHMNHVSWNPSGVAVVITPWNAPLMLATWRIAPALAAGDAVIAKPPEWAPLSASLLADITRDAGMPDGAFNVVQGIGEEAGAALVAHPDVGRVAFTGSVETGRLVAASAGVNLTPVSLELGGKAPFLIFADTDLDAAVKQAVNQFDNAGQVCLAGTRLLSRMRSTTSSWHGSPRPPPRSDREIRARRRATSDRRSPRSTSTGSTATCSARRPRVWRSCSAAGRTRSSAACTTGPRCSASRRGMRRSSSTRSSVPSSRSSDSPREEEGIALANDTTYGLSAIVYTGDRDRAERVSAALVAGTVWVNSFYVRDLRAPFGGSRNSGIGREGGFWSFDFYSDVKNVCMAPWT